MSDKRIKITVEASDAAQAKLLTAFLQLSFRKLGTFPQVISTDVLGVNRLGADDWTNGNEMIKMVTAEGAPLISISDGSVEAKALADKAKADAERAEVVAREGLDRVDAK